MPLPPFEYRAAGTLEEACALLAEHGRDARVMAGGTDLLLRLRRPGATPPKLVIGLRGVPGLAQVEATRGQGLAIGALARLQAVAGHPDVVRFYPALAAAARATATVQIRNMGTLVGNLCNASPAADTAAPLLAYRAELLVRGPAGCGRTIPLDAFFVGPGRTTLERGELVERVIAPPLADRMGSDYQRLSARSTVDIAAVSVATLVQLDSAGLCTSARIALGAVAPTPLRVPAAEGILEGRAPTKDLIAQAAQESARACSPISDVRASAAYRREMVRVLTARSLASSLARASAQE